MFLFEKKLKNVAKDTDKYLDKFLKQQELGSNLLKPMRYGLFSGGKKFRSKIIVDTGKIFNIDYNTLISVSAAVECIHSYSLIHDDLPCMDNDEIRRGKLSTHKKFGESTAVLAGNSLLTFAFEILSDKKLKLNNTVKIELINELASCSGHSGIAGGQYLDLDFERKKINQSKIINMQNKKTGKLFSFCCESSAIIKKKNLFTRKNLNQIGLEIGLLYQISDDLLDLRGNGKNIGKLTKKDKARGKATLINLLGYQKSLKFAYSLKNKISRKIEKYGSRANDLLTSLEYIIQRKS
tara:strand:+ start:489 stop:1373 length:885 start_codon:yes stop_codon:yes gene_type:complete